MKKIPYRTIIVDDEPPAIQRLLELVTHFPEDFEVIGQAANGGEAIELIESLNPDLLFLDIQMPGMSGFEMLQQLSEIPMVIFCTAFDEYALQAFETNCVDYLLKPVKLERLEQTIAKLDHFKQNVDTGKIMEFLREYSKQPLKKTMTSITIRKGSKIQFVKLEDITYFKASDKYVSLFNKNGEENITEKTLIQLETELPDYFLRVHRSVIINTPYVKEIQKTFNSKYIIKLTDYYQTRITTGRNYQSHIKAWIE